MSRAPVPVEALLPFEAQIEHAQLAEEIAAHDARYHSEDAPTISDAEYDALRARLLRACWGRDEQGTGSG